MRIPFAILLLVFSVGFSSAQELKCNLMINSDKIQGTNKSVFTTLQTAATEFMNNRRWTDLAFEDNERIECSINIIVNSVEDNNFNCEMLVQARRPVFNSAYTTNLLNHRDKKVSFTYTEFETLEFNESSLNSNLTAILAFYAYLIIGYDMDSFSRLGGTPYFRAAENIAVQAQSTDWLGWRSIEKDWNRYTLINNIMDEAFKKYREYFYEYHRLGLDEMSVNVTNGRAKIAGGMEVLREAYRARPMSVLISLFLDAKNDEIINIFKQGSSEEKEKVIDILTTVNPSQTNRYEQINRK